MSAAARRRARGLGFYVSCASGPGDENWTHWRIEGGGHEIPRSGSPNRNQPNLFRLDARDGRSIKKSVSGNCSAFLATHFDAVGFPRGEKRTWNVRQMSTVRTPPGFPPMTLEPVRGIVQKLVKGTGVTAAQALEFISLLGTNCASSSERRKLWPRVQAPRNCSR